MNRSHSGQRGAVLVVALIMLLLLTIIGLASMRGTGLQESMAGNLRDGHLALQAAEAALRKGEAHVEDMFLNNTLSSLDAAPASATMTSFAGVAVSPAYTITQLAKLRTSTEAGTPGDDEGALVRVEATGYGLSLIGTNQAASVSNLRSVYLVEQ